MFIRPCEGRITSFYGRRWHPIDKEWKGHHGIDIAKIGVVPIFATASGTVSRVQPDKTFGTYGNAVTIKHAGGWESLYGHLSRYIVKLGQSVKQGQIIGYMGDTGGSTGQHLHFELHKGGWNKAYSNEVNPLHYYIDPDVKRLQQLLINAGQKIVADGKFGPVTESAVKAFQKSAGLVVDGSAGPATLAALEKVWKPVTPTVPPKKEVDEMAEKLPKTQQDDMRKLLQRAYDEKVLSVNHASKVDSMTRGEATDLLISYVARAAK